VLATLRSADDLLTEAPLLEQLAPHLVIDSWVGGKILDEGIVSRASHASNLSRLERFITAIANGFAAQVSLIEREIVALDETTTASPPAEVASWNAYRACLERGRADGFFSLYHEVDEQYANGVTPEGNDFLPLWSSAAEAEAWSIRWPGSVVIRVELATLCGPDGLLSQVSSESMWTGLGTHPGWLVMTHPLRVLVDLR
jgi:hypothetical protein